MYHIRFSREKLFGTGCKFNTTTTRLAQLNGNGIKFPQPGQVIKAEQTEPDFNPDFEQKLTIAGQGKYTEGETVFNYPKATRNFLMRTNASKGNILYGFQFLKRMLLLVLFSTV